MRSLALAAIAAALLVSAPASAVPSGAGRIAFDVTRNGQPFGRHTITVSGAEADLRAVSTVSLRATLGPLTAYSLEQTCSERWARGALTSLVCSTIKDGRRTQVRAEMVNGRLRVTGASGEHWFPATAFPSSWWTRPPLNTRTLIDTQTGSPIQVRITNMGRDTIEVAGQRITAERIRVTGSISADLWYDTQGRWVGCNFRARGQNIAYRLATPLNSAPA